MKPALARLHPIDVPLERIDLAVMAYIPIGMGPRPGGKRIGAEARVHKRQGAYHPFIGEILIVGRHLMRQQQPLIDNGVGRQARNIEVLAPLNGRLCHSLFNSLANHIQLSLKLSFVERISRDEDLPHEWLGRSCKSTDLIALDRHITPTKQAQTFFCNDLSEYLLAEPSRVGIGRQKQLADSVLAHLGQYHTRITRNPLQKRVRSL